jgi:SH3-like domain-containing protein
VKKEKPYEIHFIDDEAVLRLQIAIVEQTCKDWRKAKHDKRKRTWIEKSLLSGWGQFLTGCQSEVIIELLRKEEQEK